MTATCGAALVYQDGETALIWASECGHKDVAIALAERGADLNIKNKVSDYQLCIHDDDCDDDYDGDDDYDDDDDDDDDDADDDDNDDDDAAPDADNGDDD